MFARITKLLDKTLLPVVGWASERSFITAVRSGLVLTIPLVMLGSFAVLIENLPIEPYRQFMDDIFGVRWHDLMGAVLNGTTNIIAIIMPVSIGPFLAERYNVSNLLTPVNPIISGLVSLASLMVLIPPAGSGFLAQAWLGVPGLFLAIMVSLASTMLFLRLSSVHALRLNISGGSVEFAIPQAFNAMLPGGITILLFALIGIGVNSVWNISVHEGITQLLQSPFAFATDSLGHGLLYNFALDFFWFFGIHGANVLDPITHSVYGAAMAANVAAYGAGLPMPHIITKSFMDMYVFLGGSGASLCLLLAVFVSSREKGKRRLAFISLPPGLFNINEIILFGMPIVLNPVMLIPFICTPIILMLVSFAAVSAGIAPGPHMAVQWTTPIFLNGYISTGSMAAPMLQLFNLILGTCIYIPFIILGDRIRTRYLREAFHELMDRSVNIKTSGLSTPNLARNDAAGALARSLVIEMQQACESREHDIFLVYHPQVTAKGGNICGVEALLRWNHSEYGIIPAPISVNLAEESGLITSLGLRILDEACATRRHWLDNGVKNLVMAVNVSALQLKPELVDNVRNVLRFYELPPYMIELEVTESSALDPDSPESSILYDLHKLGVRLAIDDFGMGHSSLKYLKQFPVDVIKIDGAITKEVTFNAICSDIVGSITKLCRARDIMSVVEFVETEEQIAELNKHGCDVFQGWYFSKPLPADECLEFIRKHGGA